jgi:zinc-binding alcohol dehydrogenase/oxidoreductase
MLALILKGKESEPAIEDIDLPPPAEGWVAIQLRAASINHRDIWIQKGLYAGLTYPIIPGSDGAGFLDNQPVIINPGMEWGDDERFQSTDFKILGMPDNGTFSQCVHVPQNQVYPMPPHLSFEEAAAIPLAGVTAYRALFTQGQLKPTDRVLITGIGGGVALWAFQFALTIGAEVWVSSSSDEKLALSKRMGAAGSFNYKEIQWTEAAKKAGGFDLVIDGASGPALSDYIKLAKPGGRIVLYGGTVGPTGPLVPQIIFWKQLQIIGSTMGSKQDFELMLAFINQHQLAPNIDKVYPLNEGARAFQRMAQGAQFGKIILQIPA